MKLKTGIVYVSAVAAAQFLASAVSDGDQVDYWTKHLQQRRYNDHLTPQIGMRLPFVGKGRGNVFYAARDLERYAKKVCSVVSSREAKARRTMSSVSLPAKTIKPQLMLLTPLTRQQALDL